MLSRQCIITFQYLAYVDSMLPPLQLDLPDPNDEDAPKRRGDSKGGSVLTQRGVDKQLMELAGRTMQHAER